MGAHVIETGPPAHEDERAALAFLAQGLPESATVFLNPWLTQPSGAVFEVDAIVALPHAVFLVEVKSWRGLVRGGPRDWVLHDGEVRQSPLLLGRKTAQVLHGLLQRRSYEAGRVWTQELVFLPAADRFDGAPHAVRSRVTTREDLHATLLDPALVEGWSNGRRVGPVTDEVRGELVRLLRGPPAERPTTRIAGYKIIDRFDTNERFSEVLGEDATGARRLLRVYRFPWQATEPERAQLRKRALWEAQILRSFERAPPELGLPRALPPVDTDDGVVVPMEHFPGRSLPAWLDAFGAELTLAERVTLWARVARGVQWMHDKGVVHRHLRADLVKLADPEPDTRPDPSAVPFRITGFDLAKRLSSDTTVAVSAATLERLEGAAPEVVHALSDAEPRSDQFSLGVLLAHLALREPLVPSTLPLVEKRAPLPRLRERASLPQRLDEAVARMVERRPTDRFPHVNAAIDAALAAVEAPSPGPRPGLLRPGDVIGPDHVVEEAIGAGGLADVYRVKHKLLGQRFALKVARPTETAEAALRAEYEALRRLDHPQVVRAHALSAMVEGRITLVLDFVDGRTLTAAAPALAPGDVSARRRLAEDLLGALDAFERQGIAHNDLKPDNLLVTPAGRLVLIDFSLASGRALEAETGQRPMLGGTWEWRDPSGERGHPADRYAAAMCLFWIHAGRHPFDGVAPEPDQAPDLDAAELEPPGLAPFLAQALHPDPSRRFRSAAAMREAYLVALGAAAPDEPSAADGLDADTPLSQTPLPSRAVRCLRAAQVRTVGDLLALSPEALDAVHGLGARMVARVRAFAESAARADVPARPAPVAELPPFFLPLLDAWEPVDELSADTALLRALHRAGLRTVGAVARSSRPELNRVPGLGPRGLVRLGESLVRFADARRARADLPVRTLDATWADASRRLEDEARRLLERSLGLVGEATPQAELARELGLDQPTVSTRRTQAVERLDLEALRPALDALDAYLDAEHGLLPVSLAAARLARDLPTAGIEAVGVVRLACAVDTAAFAWLDHVHDGTDAVLARPGWVDREVLRGFVGAVARLADGWPPTPAAAARTTLRMVLPDYQGDPLVLAARLVPDLAATSGGALFRPPLDPDKALGWALEGERGPLPLDALPERLRAAFGEHAPPLPPPHALAELLERGPWRVDGAQLLRRDAAAPAADPQRSADLHGFLDIPAALDPRRRVVDTLRAAAAHGAAFRLVVAAPERDVAIARSLVDALDATGLDLADAWFSRHAPTLDRDARAARIPALRADTARRMGALIDELVAAHGRPGARVVLYRTGLLEALGALEELRLLYDRVSGRAAGLWIAVIPGVVSEREPRQPLFNGRTPTWRQPGLVLPLNEPVPR